MAGRLVETYLRDRLAVLVAGAALARRFVGQRENAEFADGGREVLRGLLDDRAALEAEMRTLDVAPSRLKNGAGWLAERLGRLKLNGRLVRYSPLSRLVELEGLLAVTALRQSLWRALAVTADVRPAADGVRCEERERLAAEQYERLERLHARAARLALPE